MVCHFVEFTHDREENIWHFSIRMHSEYLSRGSVLWQKQQIIAENIANANTPDYNCKYLDFAGIFRDKLRSNGTVDTEIDLVQRLFIDRVTDDQADGNNVDNDVQQGELAKAQIQYDAIMNSMNGNFARVRSAMTTK